MPNIKVELLCATIPGLRLIAEHYWFVVYDETGIHRWEVWQEANVGGRSFGHVHCNLMPPKANVGGGPTQVDSIWYGEQALRIQQALAKAEKYPFCHTYRYWPGPNSNTFAKWILREAGIEHALGPKALGKRYPVR